MEKHVNSPAGIRQSAAAAVSHIMGMNRSSKKIKTKTKLQLTVI
jgi:hypothetical protein